VKAFCILCLLSFIFYSIRENINKNPSPIQITENTAIAMSHPNIASAKAGLAISKLSHIDSNSTKEITIRTPQAAHKQQSRNS
jgi:hypothetical protein